MKIRSHYRQLGPDEVIRRGDLWQSIQHGSLVALVGRVKVPIGKTPRTHSLDYTYWRRRHVAVNAVSKQHPIEKNPLVAFRYPSSKEPWNHTLRQVRMIGANSTYIIGVQVNGPKTQFKKFRRDRMSSLQLMEFNPTAIS